MDSHRNQRHESIQQVKKRLSGMIVRIYVSHDTPSLIRLVASDSGYMALCRAMVSPSSAKEKKISSLMTDICLSLGIDPTRLRARLEPVAKALGLIVSSSKRPNYYEILGVADTATEEEIRSAYRKKVREAHPDTTRGKGRNTQVFINLQAAYETLTNPGLRAKYDRSRQYLGAWQENATTSDRDQDSTQEKRQIRLKKMVLLFGGLSVLLLFVAFIFDAVYKQSTLFEDYNADNINPSETSKDTTRTSKANVSDSKPLKANEILPEPERLVAGKRKIKERYDIPSKPSKEVFSKGAEKEALREARSMSEKPLVSQDIASVKKAVKKAESTASVLEAPEIANKEKRDKRPKKKVSEGSLGLEAGEAKGGDIHREDEADRLQSFLSSYCRAYENKDMETFTAFFAPDAIENGQPFQSMLPKYRENCEKIDKLKYELKLLGYSRQLEKGVVIIRCSFFLRWKEYNGKWDASTGTIFMKLMEQGDLYRVKELVYRFNS